MIGHESPGAYASHAWVAPLKDSPDPEWRRLIDHILTEAANVDIKVLCGLGVYS